MLLKDLPIGSRLVLGLDPNEDEMTWMKMSEDNLFLADRKAGFMPYDYYEPDSPSRARRSNGNNFWPHSNVCQWLNASGEDWYVPQHPHDRIRGAYCDAGFLDRFEPNELSIMQDMEITTLVPLGSRKEFGKTVYGTYKVVLPSFSQIYGGNCDETYDGKDKFSIEGERLPGIDMFPHIHEMGLVTRTGASDAGHVVICNTTWYDCRPASNGYHMFPLIKLSGEAQVGDKPDGEGLYRIPFTEEIPDDTFFQLISL